MQQDNRILIRLTPLENRQLRRILAAVIEQPGHASLLGIRRREVEEAASLLTRFPVLLPERKSHANQEA